MQPPRFWSNPPDRPGLLSTGLLPVAAVWKAATARRMAHGKWQKMPVPVICVGNINLGGTGKTPVVIALLERMQNMSVQAHVVSRGYGGSLQGPVMVNEKQHNAAQVGDEPLLLSAFGPTWISRDRLAGAKAATAAGADVIILDDGFQNPSLVKDFSIVVVDAAYGFGNGRVAPAGPLREPVHSGLGRAEMVMLVGGKSQQDRFLTQWQNRINIPVVRASLKPLKTGMRWKGEKLLAFAGIGRPEKFFETLRNLGADLVSTEALSDHQPLPVPLLRRLETEARTKGAQLVTTEKDAARLPPEFRTRVLTLPVRLDIPDWTLIDQKLNVLSPG